MYFLYLGVPSYEIIWADPDDVYRGLIPTENLSQAELEKLWSTIEPQALVEHTYPDLVETFKQSKIKPKKPSKRKQKKKDAVDDIDNMLQNTSISEVKPKRARRKKADKENEAAKNAKPIDSYFKKAVMNNFERQTGLSVACSTPKGKNVAHVDLDDSSFTNILKLDQSKFGDEDDSDLSDIIDDIVKQKPDRKLLENLERCGFVLADPEVVTDNRNVSSFFMHDIQEYDAFEQTFNEICEKNDSEKNEGEMDGKDDESFAICTVPLFERIKNNL